MRIALKIINIHTYKCVQNGVESYSLTRKALFPRESSLLKKYLEALCLTTLIDLIDNTFFIEVLNRLCFDIKAASTLHTIVQSFDSHFILDVFQNGQELVLQMFQGQGCSFVCKNKDEIAKVVKAGIAGQDIILENPMLVASHLKVAARENVGTVVFRSPQDLTKIKKSHPHAK